MGQGCHTLRSINDPVYPPSLLYMLLTYSMDGLLHDSDGKMSAKSTAKELLYFVVQQSK